MSKSIKAGAWYTVSEFLLKGLSIITAPIVTRVLSTADYGIASNFTSWQNLLACITGLGLSYAIGTAKNDFKDDFNGFLSSIQCLSSLFGLFVLLISWPFLGVLSDFMIIDKPLLITLLVFLIFRPSVDYLRTKYRFEYKYKENIIISVVSALSCTALSLTLIFLFKEGSKYYGMILGSTLPVLVVALICYLLILRRGRKLYNPIYWKYALKISLPMIPHGLAMIMLSQIDRIQIIRIVGEGEAGLYSFGYSYATIISIVINAINFAWMPWLYDNLHANNNKAIKKSDKDLTTMGCVIALFFVAVAPEVIMILADQKFWDAKLMVMPVIVGTLYQFYYNKFSALEMYAKKTYYAAFGSVTAAIVNYVLNLIFLPKYGYIAAAYTTLAGYLLLMIFHWIIITFVLKKNIYDSRYVFIMSLLVFVICFGITMLYDSFVVRYLVFFGLVSLYVIKNKSFINTLFAGLFERYKNNTH